MPTNSKEYRDSIKDKVQESNRRYYQKNKERLKKEEWERKKKQNYYGKLRDKDIGVAISSTLEYRIFLSAKTRAKKKNIEFDLNIEDIVIPDYCPILGVKIEFVPYSRSDSSPSLDRIDSSKGYTKDNIIIISWRANRIKNNGTWEEHLKIAEFVRGRLED